MVSIALAVPESLLILRYAIPTEHLREEREMQLIVNRCAYLTRA